MFHVKHVTVTKLYEALMVMAENVSSEQPYKAWLVSQLTVFVTQ